MQSFTRKTAHLNLVFCLEKGLLPRLAVYQFLENKHFFVIATPKIPFMNKHATEEIKRETKNKLKYLTVECNRS